MNKYYTIVLDYGIPAGPMTFKNAVDYQENEMNLGNSCIILKIVVGTDGKVVN